MQIINVSVVIKIDNGATTLPQMHRIRHGVLNTSLTG